VRSVGAVGSLLLVAAVASGCGPAESPATTAVVGASQPDRRVQRMVDDLHAEGSGAEALALYPDLIPTFVDDGHGVQGKLNPAILPFTYYWSPSGRVTVAICAVGKTQFVCPYYLDRLLTPAEFPRCDVAPAYAGPELAPTPPPGRPGLRS
jgi:hypothetical protein